MRTQDKAPRVRRTGSRSAIAIVAGATVIAAFAAAALGATTVLRVQKNTHVTNTPTKAFRVRAIDKHESVAVGPVGYAVYTFQRETTKHILCHKTTSAKTNCFGSWPPVPAGTASGLHAQAGIAGTLGSFKNQGVTQLTLNGQPLYYFALDLSSKSKTQATGDELSTFGSIWHVVIAG
jgi:predicted lipoprotein with Yx(FWY)xxD motif